MVKDERYLQEMIKGVMNNNHQWINNLYDYCKPMIEKSYRKNFLRDYGESYSGALENKCLDKIIRYVGNFRGSTWGSFNAYTLSIIKTTSINFIRDEIKPFHHRCVQYDNYDLEHIYHHRPKVGINEMGQLIRGRKYTEKEESWERIIVEGFNMGVTAAKLIVSKLSKKQRNCLIALAVNNSLTDYSRENNCSYSAAKQRKYRLKIKIDKVKDMIDPKTNTWYKN